MRRRIRSSLLELRIRLRFAGNEILFPFFFSPSGLVPQGGISVSSSANIAVQICDGSRRFKAPWAEKDHVPKGR